MPMVPQPAARGRHLLQNPRRRIVPAQNAGGDRRAAFRYRNSPNARSGDRLGAFRGRGRGSWRAGSDGTRGGRRSAVMGLISNKAELSERSQSIGAAAVDPLAGTASQDDDSDSSADEELAAQCRFDDAVQ